MLKYVNRLAKFRVMFAGWQLGTRSKGDPESDAVRDHREATLIARAELSALANLMIAKGVITKTEYAMQIEIEAQELIKMLEKRYPGFTATDDGLIIDASAA